MAGYHTEYSAMKFAMFFMAEYANMITVACLATLLFSGRMAWADFRATFLQAVLPVAWFLLKVVRISIYLYLGSRHTAAFPL